MICIYIYIHIYIYIYIYIYSCLLISMLPVSVKMISFCASPRSAIQQQKHIYIYIYIYGNCSSAPDWVLWKLIFQGVLFSGGCFFYRHLYDTAIYNATNITCHSGCRGTSKAPPPRNINRHETTTGAQKAYCITSYHIILYYIISYFCTILW